MASVGSVGVCQVIVTAKVTSPAGDEQLVAEVAQVLDRRGALKHPPVSLAVSDSVALGIAGLFRSATPSGQVLERFCRHGNADSTELIEAARVEQGYATPEGHAALHCLIGWVRAQVHRRSE
jgi:hypothetical protein